MSSLQKMSVLQLELLMVYSFNPTKEDLVQIKKMLATFFADKLTDNVSKAIEENNTSDEDLEKWLHE